MRSGSFIVPSLVVGSSGIACRLGCLVVFYSGAATIGASGRVVGGSGWFIFAMGWVIDVRLHFNTKAMTLCTVYKVLQFEILLMSEKEKLCARVVDVVYCLLHKMCFSH